ncbi:hypothetical protein FOL46_010047, partial [Perkinsus olseni]
MKVFVLRVLINFTEFEPAISERTSPAVYLEHSSTVLGDVENHRDPRPALGPVSSWWEEVEVEVGVEVEVEVEGEGEVEVVEGELFEGPTVNKVNPRRGLALIVGKINCSSKRMSVLDKTEETDQELPGDAVRAAWPQ